MPVEDLTDRRAGYSRATSGCGKLPSPGEREDSVTLAAAPLDQRDEAQQRGEHEVIARRQAVAGQSQVAMNGAKPPKIATAVLN
jgi:hypothetical protein